MTRRVNDTPRTLASRRLAERVRFEQTAARLARTEKPTDARLLAQTPAGRKQLRGIPCVGSGGLDTRRDPYLEVVDRETQREQNAAMKDWT